MLNFLWRKKNVMIVKLTSSLIFLDTIMYLSFFSPDIEISARNNKHHKNELDLQDYLLDSNEIGQTSRRNKFAVY